MEASLNHDEKSFSDSSENFQIASKDKKKKKKKKKSNKNPNGERERSFQTFQRCSSFPATRSIQIPSAKFVGGDVDSSNDSTPSASPMFCNSFPPSYAVRSALRGGQEGLGLGPRPKLHVKWAHTVHDPPVTSVSHTLTHHVKKKKANKHHKSSKHKAGKNEQIKPQINDNCRESPQVEVGAGEEDSDPTTIYSTLNNQKPPWFSSKSFFAYMEVAMQHMLQASKSIEKTDVSGALAEYKAAAHIFRLAKSDAPENEVAVTQAVKGQILAWIAMATLYSANGQVDKSMKCHHLALQACQHGGLNLQFPSPTSTSSSSHNCSMAALSLNATENPRAII